ncbi:unnamed protein product [Ceutorhynchus assimilis]|uniref:UDP-D-xylose:beta-D-glucoside alpha-1,3-D-xylosyltransferase n=1 Tax=Ceutorhynchus assimilis TaxID=467358 RepID=A0A9N9Q8G9_9CUCU|nr:unnamed protein product [Ceutorhynchus assimilis]
MRNKMRLYIYLNIAVIVSIFLIIFYLYSIKQIDYYRENVHSELSINIQNSANEIIFYKRNDIVVAVVACGDRLRESLTLIKSALMFSKAKLNFIVLAEDNLIESFTEKLEEWKSFTNNAFTYNVLPLNFPTKDGNEWKKLFKPCAAQRLFLPDILPGVDSLLYMDTDTLFLTPVESIWEYFNKFNRSQMAALAPEHEDSNIGWYNRFAKHPYYGKLGVNSGVMLMNLTRMRAFKWTEYVVPIYRKFKLHITWGDQDIINIIFHYHPGRLFLYSCRYNYRPDHCMYSSICKSAEKDGVAVMHGSRGFFHSEKQPVFKAIFNAFDSFQIGSDVYKEFYQPLETYLDALEHTNCGKVKYVFLRNLQRFLDLEFDNT